MTRLVAILAGLAAVATLAAVSVSTASAAGGGACTIHGAAKFTPGLTGKPGTVKYTFSGALSNCASSDTTLKSGTMTASGSGTLSCEGGTSTGTGTVKWNNGKSSSISFTTASAGAAVDVDGTVTGGTEFSGGRVHANLAFEATPTQCNTTTGVTSANFDGAGALVGP